MTDQQLGKMNRLAIILAVVAFLLALIAVLIKYIRFGQLDIGVLAGGIVIPAGVISIAMRNRKGSRK
jgi:hypothetical protein